MPQPKISPEQRLQGRFNMAAFRLGALHAVDLIDQKTAARLYETFNSIDRVYEAQRVLYYMPGSTHEALQKSLDLPIKKLKEKFVRQMDAVVRRLDKSKLTRRQREGLEL